VKVDFDPQNVTFVDVPEERLTLVEQEADGDR
jgi:hypothetical protein